MADCSERDPALCELYLVEGDSAGGSAKQGRDRTFQAILPLKGKILNVEKSRLDKILNNDEIRTIITALGTSIGQDFSLEKLRYHKVIIMCDADVDGSHIRTLLLTLLYRQMRPLIEAGHVYIAQPPLYKIKRGKREEYIESEEEMNNIILEMGMEGLKLKHIKEKKEYNATQFKDILSVLMDLERVVNIFKRKGIEFDKYINNLDGKSTKMPTFMVKVEGVTHFVMNEKELAEHTKGSEEAQYVEIFEHEDLEAIEERLNKYDLTLLEYIKPDLSEPIEVNKKGKKEKAVPKEKAPVLKALFQIESEDDKNEFFSLQEILEHVREQAHRGVHIQRYKGLGEMNPQQLWDTTMDPARRTILKVALEDVVEVDKTFDMLMGDEVEPRRQFIEKHAHEVENLDV